MNPFNISTLDCKSGFSTVILLSNLPDLNNAGSRISFLFVAPITIICASVVNPSISTNNWFNVLSLSSLPPDLPSDLSLPIASISSYKYYSWFIFFASSNKSLTREAPTPTYISTKSDPDIPKNDAPDSPATALASNVLPVPGSP